MLEASIIGDLLVFDESQLDACLADIRALGCDLLATRWPASCEAMLAGTAADGETCFADLDCAGDAYCAYETAGMCPGTCTPRAAADGDCSPGADNECQNGLVCVDSIGKCKAPAVAGEPCVTDGAPPCAYGFDCVEVNDVATCRSLTDIYAGEEGDDCNPSEGRLCIKDLSRDLNLVCSRASRTCVRAVLSNDGCSEAFPDPCPAEQYCNEVDGACRLRETVERACDPGVEKMCAEGYVCIDDECVPLSAAGQGCTADETCYSDNCNLELGVCDPVVVCE